MPLRLSSRPATTCAVFSRSRPVVRRKIAFSLSSLFFRRRLPYSFRSSGRLGWCSSIGGQWRGTSRCRVDGLEGEWHELLHTFPALLWENDSAQEAPPDAQESVLGPRVEKVDRRAVHNCREAASARPEFFARRERKHDVKILSHVLQKEIPEAHAVCAIPRSLGLAGHVIDDGINVLLRKEVGNVSEERRSLRNTRNFTRDLGVREEGDGLILAAGACTFPAGQS